MSDLSRRALMAGAAVSVLAGPAASAHADAALLDLGRRLSPANEQWDASCRHLADARARYIEPASPEALFRRPTDSIAVTAGAVRRDGRLWLGMDVEAIRTLPCGWSYDNPDGTVGWHDSLGDRERRDEIVAAGAEFEAAKATARKACGLSDAAAEHAAAVKLSGDLRSEIVATPAATLAGVLVKVRAAAWIYGGPEGLDEAIDNELHGSAEALALDVLRDLLRLAEPDGMPAA